jgi:glycosyltransferase involved in cell wall biosynthesis
MSDKLNISIVLPIKSSLSRDFAEYFGKAIQSIKNQIVGVDELVIVHTQEESLITFLNSFDFGDLNVSKYVFEEDPTYSGQMNFGIEKVVPFPL